MTAAATITQPQRESVFKPAALLMCGRMMSFAATFFIPVVLARVFNQAEFGTYKQLFLIQSTICLVAQCGMATSLYYFLPKSPEDGGRFVANSLLFLSAVGGAAWAALAWSAPVISRWMNNPRLAEYLAWIGLYLCLMMAGSAFEMVLIAHHRYLAATAAYVISDLARAAGFILPALVFGQLIWLLKSAALVAAARVVCALFYYRRAFGATLRPCPALFRTQMKYAWPFAIAVLLEILQGNLPSYVVSSITNPATFAIFAVGCLQIPLVDFATSPTSDVMMVAMQERLKQGRMRAILEIWHDTTWKLALLLVPLVALIAVVARDLIVLLFSSRYLESVPIFITWSAMILLAPLQVDGVLRVFAETRLIMALNLVRVALIAGLLKWSLSALHLVGPVLVVGLALLIFKIAALARIRTLLHVRTSELLPWRDLANLVVIAGTAAMAARLASTLLRAPLAVHLLATSAVYGVALVGLAWQTHLLNAEEQAAIARTLRRPAQWMCCWKATS